MFAVLRKPNHPPRRLVVLAVLCAVGSFAPAVYQAAGLNQIVNVFRAFYNQSNIAQHRRNTGTLSEDQFAFFWGLTLSLFSVGCLLSAVISPYLLEKLGRRKALVIVQPVLYTAGVILTDSAYFSNVWQLVLVGRLIIGCSATFSFQLPGLYLTECSPKEHRGFLFSILAFSHPLANLLPSLLGVPQVLGNDRRWPAYVSFPLIFTIALVFCHSLIPESPTYLLIRKHDEARAIKVLKDLHGPDFDENESLICARLEASQSIGHVSPREIWEMFHLRRATLLGIAVMAAVSFSGVFVISATSTMVFEDIGLSREDATYSTIAMNVLTPFWAAIFMLIVNRVNRRVLFIGGLAVYAFGNVLFCILSAIGRALNARWLLYLAVAVVILNYGVSFMGPMPLLSAYPSEFTPQNARSAITSICVVAFQLFLGLLMLAFPPLLEKVRAWALVILFTLPSIPLIVLLYFYLPETRNLSVGNVVERLLLSRSTVAGASFVKSDVESTDLYPLMSAHSRTNNGEGTVEARIAGYGSI